MLNEGMYYEGLEGKKVKCQLCPHQCLLKPGQAGICRVRHNEDGTLYAANYGRVSSMNIDPIEKKPLYHFYPGSNILSVGTFGCNLSCPFCQNYSIAHGTPKTYSIEPGDLCRLALEHRESSIGVAFTYNEPLIWYEYVIRAAQKIKEAGLKVVLVSNAFVQPEPLKELLPFVDAVNFDVKAFNNEFYRKTCRGSLDIVKNNVELAVQKIHVEITNLLIPGDNDHPDEIASLAKWIAALNRAVPLHFSRYFPAYRFSKQSTAPGILEKARSIALQYLHYVYLGNIAGQDNNTYCPVCGQLLVRREGYGVVITGIADKKCRNCQMDIDFIL
jgi:pyruvate formate lyase activating enzyme